MDAAWTLAPEALLASDDAFAEMSLPEEPPPPQAARETSRASASARKADGVAPAGGREWVVRGM